jgi:hypothetical protein
VDRIKSAERQLSGADQARDEAGAEVAFDAVLYNLVVIGEAVNALPAEITAQEPAGGHAWGRAYCPGGLDGCRPPTSIWSTPRSPEAHARRLRRLVDQCPHGHDDTATKGR